jgi:hypothetical protein
MTKPLPPRPNVRYCTHIKVTGQQCGSPALRGEFFCYFHTRVIKGVEQRVDMRLDSTALLEDCEAIQLSIMHVVDGLVKGTLDSTRARLIIQALRIAARNARNVRFDNCYYEEDEQKMIRQVPNYARQYLIEHPEYGPPLDLKNKKNDACGAGAPARVAAAKHPSPCSAGTTVRGAKVTAPAQRETPAPAVVSQPYASAASATVEPAAERNRKTSRGAATEYSPRRKPWVETRK